MSAGLKSRIAMLLKKRDHAKAQYDLWRYRATNIKSTIDGLGFSDVRQPLYGRQLSRALEHQLQWKSQYDNACKQLKEAHYIPQVK